MDPAFYGCLGQRNCDGRISSRLHNCSTQEVPHVQSTPQPSEGKSLSTVYRQDGEIRSCSSSTLHGEILRVLLQPVYSTKEGWGTTASTRSQGSQQIHSVDTLQDGNVEVGNSGDGTGSTDDVLRHQRCLPTCTDLASSSMLSPIRIQKQALSVRGASVRTIVRPQSVHEVNGCNSGHVEATRDFSDPLLGRPPPEGQIRDEGQGGFTEGGTVVTGLRMDHQLVEVQSPPQPQHVVSGSGIQHDFADCKSTRRKTDQDQGSGAVTLIQPMDNGAQGNASFRDDGVSHRGGTFRTNTPSTASSKHSYFMERGSAISTPFIITTDKESIAVVAESEEPSSRSILGNPELGCDINGCQSSGMGCDLLQSVSTRSMVSRGIQTTDKYPRTKSSKASPSSMDETACRKTNTHSKRQRYNGSVHKPSGRHEKSGSTDGSKTNSTLGRDQFSTAICNSHSGNIQYKGRLPQSKSSGSRGMGTTPRSVRSTHESMGHSQHRPNGFQKQPKSNKVFRPLQGSVGTGGGCHDPALEFQSSLCIPSTSYATESAQKDQTISIDGNCGSTILASENVVHRSTGNVNRSASSAGVQTRSSAAGAHNTPQPRTVLFDGMAVEISIWKSQGLDEEVIPTMLKARKASSSRSYHRVWHSYYNWCKESDFPFLELQLPRILSFLQQGLKMGLKLSSLKVQVSALSILFQSRLANEDIIRTFLQGVAHIMPPFRPPVAGWDLNLVLEALLDPPFEPLSSVSDTWITYKVVFLVAISSTRRVSELSALSCEPPYLIFHKDKAVLRTVPTFLPKVVSAFHVNQEIVVPSLCPDPKNDKERRLHKLDVVRALRWYIDRSKSFRKSPALFVLPSGPRRGQPASKSVLSRWIRESIKQAYSAKGKPPPEGLRAHSTRAVGASWAWRNSASLEQICKAATWSSTHTFAKFYKVDTYSSAEASLGRMVLQSVIK
ncbi:uncharacterized protein LOC121394688 isoform X2 [Xenopus laevis]|uniref:Uncharacterized protein LOC121394688 isoform X1 n=1 Tax=Xenopus laevis TaxID=8355 RepID=A0A8J1KY38_XENLA|nr:uncharacterized protein LOC121394688 isoform X1 [Xenopus laevis]XP_041422221.1 uncharacterized protein LOC121394688 isoform X2 [Xenopus laevis]